MTFAVELVALTKRFGEVRANDGVTLRVPGGTIHGVVGENGAGKSTAMKMLYGMFSPDSGEIRLDGVAFRWRSPEDAIRAGVGMVHQHFMLAGPHSVLDNVVVGAEPAAASFRFLPRSLRPIDRAGARRRISELSTRHGLPVDLDAALERLPVGLQQRVEILKLLYREARVLILDEPTAVLTPQEVQDLFSQLRRLRDEGKTILIITHKLREVLELCDGVTVLRGGKSVGEVATAGTSPQELADLMVGRKVSLSVEPPPPAEAGEAVLEVLGLTLRSASRASVLHRLFDVTFDVKAGEVVGIAGVEGNGQSELLQALLHPGDPDCRSSGTVRMLGRDVSDWMASSVLGLGVGFVPEDRHRDGLLLDRPVEESFLLGLHRRPTFAGRGGLLRARAVRGAAERALEEFDVRPRRLDVQAASLSGGNQQKLILAREFHREPRLLIAAQPTRGVDVGAIELIHRQILRVRAGGAGVLLVSSELEEILGLSDRILVFYEGQVVARFTRGQCTERELGLRMGGGVSA